MGAGTALMARTYGVHVSTDLGQVVIFAEESVVSFCAKLTGDRARVGFRSLAVGGHELQGDRTSGLEPAPERWMRDYARNGLDRAA